MPAESLDVSTLDEPELRTVIVAAYSTPIEAEMAKSRLEIEGIGADLVDLHTVSIGTHLSIAVGGVKVRVLEDDAEQAREVLSNLGEFVLPDTFDEEPPALARSSSPEPTSSEALASRALATGVIGALFLPPLNLYSLWLVLKALRSDEALSPKARRLAWGAVAFDVLGLVWLAVLMRL